MNLEICIHCYKYSRLLNLQLSSYYLHGGDSLKNIKHIIYTCEEDSQTNEMCGFFQDKINLEKRILSFGELAARGYGRDLAVKECSSEWIWFADADHLISDGTLDFLLDYLSSTKFHFLYPCLAIKNKNEQDVDDYLKKINVPSIVDFDFERMGMETAVKRHPIASGGVQIFRANKIKQCGYAYKHKSIPEWRSCKDDIRARRRFDAMFPGSKTNFEMKGHRHLTHKVKRKNDYSAEL